jgi:hypothetical protein
MVEAESILQHNLALGETQTMLTSRYLSSYKNVPAIMQKIIEGVPPESFTISHLQGLGFKNSADRAIIPLLKELGFLTADGKPTPRYHEYRDKSKSKRVMAQALREAYGDIFHVNEDPTKATKEELVGKFKTATGTSDRVAEAQYHTFKTFLSLADLVAPPLSDITPLEQDEIEEDDETKEEEKPAKRRRVTAPEEFEAPPTSLRYNIEIHLPPTKDIEVYNAIFKSLREHLLD